jgi:hypothetical protein
MGDYDLSFNGLTNKRISTRHAQYRLSLSQVTSIWNYTEVNVVSTATKLE